MYLSHLSIRQSFLWHILFLVDYLIQIPWFPALVETCIIDRQNY